MASQSKSASTWTVASPKITSDITYIPAFTIRKGSKTNTLLCPANEYVSSTSAGLTASSKCKTGYTGTMTWTCGNDGEWTSDESKCKKSTIISGFPDNYIYISGAAIFAFLAILLI